MVHERGLVARRPRTATVLLAMVLATLAGSMVGSPSLACITCGDCECVEVIGDGAYNCHVDKKEGQAACGVLWRFLGLCEGSYVECSCTTSDPCRKGSEGLTPEIKG